MVTPYLIVGLGLVGAVLDIASTTPTPEALAEYVSRLGTIGLLAVAVIVLWRKLQEKDGLLLTNYKAMAEALAANKVVVDRMAETLVRIEHAVEKLDTVRNALTPGR